MQKKLKSFYCLIFTTILRQWNCPYYQEIVPIRNIIHTPKKDSRNLDRWASITTYVHVAPSNHILISLSFSWIVHILPLMPLNPGYVQPELTWVAHQTGSVCFCSSTPNFVPAGLFFWFISMPSSVMEQGNYVNQDICSMFNAKSCTDRSQNK